MLGLIEAQIVSRGRYGRTKIVKLNVQPKIIEEVMLEDKYLEGILQ